MIISRGFLDVRGRTVHYRRAGAGPALVLLHGSPNSSLSLEPLMTAFAPSFDCIAFDTPGNGDSDALAQDAPMTEDYAQALAETVDAFGLKRFALYGFHTGAGTAAEYAARQPARVSALVLDGVAAWNAEEKSRMLDGYLPPFLPQWGGAHLAWLWSRVVEQTMFFPWHRPTRETRMNYDMPPVDILHRTAMEFLRSGDNYRKPYAAALAGDGAARVRRLASPALITAHPMDPIAHHLDRLSDYGPKVTVRKETQTDKAAISDSFAVFLRAHPGDPAPPAPVTGKRRYAKTPLGQIALRMNEAAGSPILLLHDAGGSSALFDAALEANRRVIAADLPGHGESAAPMANSIDATADAIEGALKDIGVADSAAAGFGLGGLVACALKKRGRVAAAAMIGAPRARTARPPDLAPRLDGGHLHAAWHFVRLRTLYRDWSQRGHEGVAWTAPALDPAFTHQRTLDLLKCDNRHAAAFAAESDGERLADFADALYLPACDPSGLDEASAAAAAHMPRRPLPDAPEDWGATLAKFGA